MPKIDPETQQLYDEINGMIQKFKVKFLKRKIKQLNKNYVILFHRMIKRRRKTVH